MPKKSLNPVAQETIVLQDGGLTLQIPRDVLRQLLPVDATTNQIVLADAGAKVSIQHEAGDGQPGMYYNYTLALRVTREPLNDDERDKVNALRAQSDAIKKQRTADEQSRRDREMSEAVRRERESLEHGMAIAAAKSENRGDDLGSMISKVVAEKVAKALGA